MKRSRTFTAALIMLGSGLFAACASSSVATDTDSAGGEPGKDAAAPSPPAAPTPAAGTQEGDWAEIEKLEGEAKALAKTSGCTDAAQCRSGPVGSRGCGGPRYYLPYCAATTDSAALFRKLDEIATAEKAYNAKYQIGSTCEMRLPPALSITGGACSAQ
jgi:hypothetical protein